jgi:DNA-binding transcriptional ArsR family regulator
MSARRRPDVDALFAALADPSRRRAVELLGQGPRRAGELADLLDLPAPAMSRHLKELKSAGLVAETHPEFDARVRVYALNTQRLSELKDWLAR